MLDAVGSEGIRVHKLAVRTIPHSGNRTSSSITMASERDPLSKPLTISSSKRPLPRSTHCSIVCLVQHPESAGSSTAVARTLRNPLRKNDFIFREGESEYFHIVKEGTVKCVKSTSDGNECTLKMLMPGDLFCCDAAAFDGANHPGNAQPMGNVSILRMHKSAYFNMLKRNPDAAIEVIKYLGNRLHEA